MEEIRDDAALVAAIRAGDDRAFDALYRRWCDRCFDVARRILHDDGRAAEVTQEVFTVAWRQLDTLRDPAAFGGWVLRTARNRALNRLDHERRAVATDDASPVLSTLAAAADVEAEAGASEHLELVWAAAAALGERDASVLDLHLRHGLSVPEIAEELGVTTNNAHQLLHRMKQRLGAGIRAWVVFRGGDTSCPALAVALDDAGVTRFGPEAVKAIGRHLDDCDDCTRRQAAVLAPEALFASAPLALLAPQLRDAIGAGLRQAGVPVGGTAGGGSAGDGTSGGTAGGTGGGTGDGTGGDGTAGGARGGPVADGARRRPRALAAVAVVVVVAAIVVALLVTRGGDGGDDASSAADRVATTVAGGFGGGSEPAGPDTTTTVATTVAGGGDLVGTWVADASDILASNTANVGGPGGLACSGPITMTFTDAGTYARSGGVTCAAGALSASGTVATSGTYAVTGDGLTISGTTNAGSISLGGRSVPFPDAFGDGRATYAVSGGTLEITFTGPGVGEVTQTYRRA